MNNFKVSNQKELYPLTHPEKRIWYLEKIYPNTSMHNIGGFVRIKGNINFGVLEKAINIFIKKNEGIRLQFTEHTGQIMQYVNDYDKYLVEFFEFDKYNNSEYEFNKWVSKEIEKPFPIENSRLFYFAMFRISDNETGYLAKLHHIIADGWSTNIMTEQIYDIYTKLASGEEVNNEVVYTYLDYIENEKKYLNSTKFIKNKDFWNKRFKDIPENILDLRMEDTKGARKSFSFDIDKSQELREFTKKNKVSLNTFFVATFLIYLSKVNDINDIVIGTPVLNRCGKNEKNVVGMYTSTMPFRFKVNDEYTFSEFMQSVNEELMRCYLNQKYPYDILVQDLELNKKGRDSLYDICVNYYNTRHKTELNGMRVDTTEFYNGNQAYSLQLVIKDWSDTGSLALDFDYKVKLFTEKQIENMYIWINNLITQILFNPFEKIYNMDILSEDEKYELIYGYNQTEQAYPEEKTIYELFEEQVERTPNKIAVSFKNKQLTYRELNERANQLSRILIDNGVEEEKIVGIMANHSIETIISIFAILKAGGAYLPIDPECPEDRISYMLKDCKITVMITNCYVNDNINFDGKILDLNICNFDTRESSNLQRKCNPDSLAYVIYTSGSTGKPKGVMIEHRGLVNYIWWAKKMYIKNDNEIFALYSSLAFDLTITSIFTPLISGNEIMIYLNDGDEHVLYKIIKENIVTVIKLTPSHLALIKDRDNKSSAVRRLIVGGEELNTFLARNIYESFEGNVEIFNEYGPTETVVGCIIHKFDFYNDKSTCVPIGFPADNVKIYILDKQLKPVPNGNIGEIYISGDGVARGYINEGYLTSERFIHNPFICGKRMYKTGDLARRLSNGEIEFIERIDSQVKIRGYRVELKEIEIQLLQYTNIRDVAVDIQVYGDSKYLCAYIVTNEQIPSNKLREFLSNCLPEYMIPTYFIKLDHIPLSSNGKVDRTKLPKPEIILNNKDNFIDSRNEKETKMIKAISEVIGIEKISVKDNFYHMGGDSIKAIQIASNLNRNGFKIKVKDILSNPVIEEMAACIKVDKDENFTDQGPYSGSIKATPIVSWFFAQDLKNFNYYNQSILIELKHDFKFKDIENMINQLIKHHDSLRMNYDYQKRELYYNERYLNNYNKVYLYDLSKYSVEEQKEQISIIGEKLKSSINIENDILIKSCIFKLGNHYDKLLITAHHLIVDGVSWRIILDDIYIMLKQIFKGQELKLSKKTDSMQKWSQMLEEQTSNILLREKDYWDLTLSKEFIFPVDFNIVECVTEIKGTIRKSLGEEETYNLLHQANFPYNTEANDLLIAALAITLKETLGKDEVIIELESHGREDIFDGIDLTRTVGWFTSIYPLYIKVPEDDISSAIKSIKEQIKNVPNNGIGFGILKYLSKSLKCKENKYIRFNYLGDICSQYDNDLLKLLDEKSGEECSSQNNLSCLIDINCIVMDKNLNITATYNKNIFNDSTITEFLEKYINNIKKIVKHCCDKKRIEFTPSDFEVADISQEDLTLLFN